MDIHRYSWNKGKNGPHKYFDISLTLIYYGFPIIIPITIPQIDLQ